MNKADQIILDILKEAKSYDMETSIDPVELSKKAMALGVEQPRDIEAALVRLIDQDLVEYEMDEVARPSNFWILREDFSRDDDI